MAFGDFEWVKFDRSAEEICPAASYGADMAFKNKSLAIRIIRSNRLRTFSFF